MLKRTKYAEDSEYVRNGGCYIYHYRFVEDNDSGTEDSDVEPLSLYKDDVRPDGKNGPRLRRIYDKMAPKRPFPALDPTLVPPSGVEIAATKSEAKSHKVLTLKTIQIDKKKRSWAEAAEKLFTFIDANRKASPKSSVASDLVQPATDHGNGTCPSTNAPLKLTSELLAALDGSEFDKVYVDYFAADDLSACDTDIEYSDDMSDAISSHEMDDLDESYVILPSSPYLKPHSVVPPEAVPRQVVIEKRAILDVLPVYQDMIISDEIEAIKWQEQGSHETFEEENSKIEERIIQCYERETNWATVFCERLESDTYGLISDLDIIRTRIALMQKVVSLSCFEVAKATQARIYDERLVTKRIINQLQNRMLLLGNFDEMRRRRCLYSDLRLQGKTTKGDMAAEVRKTNRVLMGRRLALYGRRAHNTKAAVLKSSLVRDLRKAFDFPALSEDDVFPTAVNEAMRLRDFKRPYQYPADQPRPHYPPKPREMPIYHFGLSDLANAQQ